MASSFISGMASSFTRQIAITNHLATVFWLPSGMASCFTSRFISSYAEVFTMEKIRLSKRMSELGLCSRREADSYIEKGWVEVDGEIVSELGSKVYLTQQVKLRTAAQNTQQQRVTILLNKPVGYVSLIHISEPTRLGMISYAVFCLKKKKK